MARRATTAADWKQPMAAPVTEKTAYEPGQLSLLDDAKFALGERVKLTGRDKNTDHLPKVGTLGTIAGGPYAVRAQNRSVHAYRVVWDGLYGFGQSLIDEVFLSPELEAGNG